jgi:arylsulfatase A-like enzyme
VVLVTADALRADVVEGVADDLAVDTPNLDRFREGALNFSRAYANAPHTRGSFPAILTGTYPWTYGGYDTISDARPALSSVFADAGYATGGFHSNPYLGREFGYDAGFDRFFANDDRPSGLARLRHYLTQRFSGERKDTVLYAAIERTHAWLSYITGVDVGLPYVTGASLNDIVMDWMTSSEEPLFCWMHYMDVHDPYLPRGGTVSEGLSARRAVRVQKRLTSGADAIDDHDREDLERLYRGEVRYLDRCLGSLFERIESELGPTVMAFLSDHGEAFGEHDYYRHPDAFHDELARIPLSIHGPGIAAGAVTVPVSAVDIGPTLLDRCGIDVPSECDGTTLLGSADPEGQVFAQTGNRMEGLVMTLTNRWKLILDLEEGSRRLYDLESDPGETRDAAGDHPEVVERLEGDIESHLERIDGMEGASDADVEVSPDAWDRLRRLGYTD